MWAASLALNGLIGRGVPRTGPPRHRSPAHRPARAGSCPEFWLVVLPSLLRGAIGPEAGEAGPVRRAGAALQPRGQALRIEEARIIRTEQFFQQMGWYPACRLRAEREAASPASAPT